MLIIVLSSGCVASIMHLVTSVQASHSKDKSYTLFPLALWTYVVSLISLSLWRTNADITRSHSVWQKSPQGSPAVRCSRCHTSSGTLPLRSPRSSISRAPAGVAAAGRAGAARETASPVWCRCDGLPNPCGSGTTTTTPLRRRPQLRPSLGMTATSS